jgi:competence protein ComEC
VTLHALALAALLILLLQPEAVVDPGFQMSFAATAALVALAEAWPRQVREINTPWPIRIMQGAMAWLGISLGASFVAGLATGPIAMQSFNRVAVYGLVANLVTEPLESFVIMPALALGAVGQPLGFGAPFLAIAGFGIRLLNSAAIWFAHLPGAVWLAPSAPDFTLPIAFVGMLFICLWKGRLRWLGVPFALCVALWPRPPAPDAWVADDGAAAVIRSDRQALALRPDARAFAADLWSRRRGLVLADGSGRFDCNRNRCFVQDPVPVRLAGWWTRRRLTPAQAAQLCNGAEVVVVRGEGPQPGACAHALVLGGPDFDRGGSAELFRTPHGWRIVWAQDLRGRRPWTRASGEPS